MISFVRGKLVDIFGDKIIVDTGNFGMEINVPSSVISKLPVMNEDVLIYTYFKVAEDAMSLYGFNTRKELDIFKLLISVNGVGPKGALAILSILDICDLVIAIMGEDDKTISKANGIGPKTAKRIIIELKDKIDLSGLTLEKEINNENNLSSSVFKETVEALVALGYSATEATKAVKAIDLDENMSSSKALRLALKNM